MQTIKDGIGTYCLSSRRTSPALWCDLGGLFSESVYEQMRWRRIMIEQHADLLTREGHLPSAPSYAWSGRDQKEEVRPECAIAQISTCNGALMAGPNRAAWRFIGRRCELTTTVCCVTEKAGAGGGGAWYDFSQCQ